MSEGALNRWQMKGGRWAEVLAAGPMIMLAFLLRIINAQHSRMVHGWKGRKGREELGRSGKRAGIHSQKREKRERGGRHAPVAPPNLGCMYMHCISCALRYVCMKVCMCLNVCMVRAAQLQSKQRAMQRCAHCCAAGRDAPQPGRA